ncbi:MAG TPA: phosphate acetyltransferase [Candidatus Cloacimonadota bacterium]|nr:phosphate acetyltransferase [Candidatus Cloacimonadota bacterium]
MGIIEDLKTRAKAQQKTIVLPESQDERTLKAASIIRSEGLSEVILLGEQTRILDDASALGLDLSTCTIINPQASDLIDVFSTAFFNKRKEKGITHDQALVAVKNQLYFGALLVQHGIAQGMVAGATNTTADVLRAALQVVGVKRGLKTVSSTFIMVSPRAEDPALMFADCAVVPCPSDEQLADIAISTAETRRLIMGDEPYVALLSFSTKGSAEHELVSKVQSAVQILDARKVDFAYDGELQLDAALVPKVAASKAKGSLVAGKANTLVFPDLQAGNIGYKLVQRLGNYEAIGPIIQGLAAPICDLSRGCSVDDIVNTAALVILLAQNTQS